MRRECKVEVHEDNDIPTIEIMGDLSADTAKDLFNSSACQLVLEIPECNSLTKRIIAATLGPL